MSPAENIGESASERPGPGTLSVVGVGASAGGLTATTQLLSHLGSEPHLALVIVHHLDPQHASSLAEILARSTPMPVITVADGTHLEVDHVYVAPPGFALSIADGRLFLEQRQRTDGLHLVVDQFFESLAVDRRVNALGVILSGNGRDGTRGTQAIKAEGGITFAQDSSAEYRGMPESAASTGCVDFILSPEAIAQALIRICKKPQVSIDSDDTPAFQRILAELRRTSGIDFANYKHSTLRRRVERRMVVAGVESLAGYADLVESKPEETRTLSDEVLIHVTSFFRDPEIFEALKATVFPKLLEHRVREASIRVWVPGCSSGEEVYSIAISLIEFLSDAHVVDVRVKLFGTDVSSSTIDVARAGRYPASIERDVSQGRLDRFFTRIEGGYQVRKDLRDLCVFARQDATRDPPFAGMDLISCRNLMIYLGTPLQDRILPIFHYALKEPGFLVLGTSESVRSFPGFNPIDAKNRIYGRTSAAPRLIFDFSNRRTTDLVPAEEPAGSKPASGLDVQREADRLVLAEFGPPGVVVTEDLAIVQFRGRTGPFLEPTPGVPSFDLMRMVRDELRVPLRQTIDEARMRQGTARRTGVVLSQGSGQSIELEVIPFRVAANSQRFFVVLFREVELSERKTAEPAASLPPPPGEENPLGQELASTRDYLQSVIEQLEASNEELKAANEEIVSSNEELRSTNEELQMAKEELQATNEELRTVNEEMTVRNAEATRLNDDLTNVLSSVEIPIVIVGRDSRVRRYTPAAARVFHLLPADIGRSIGQTRALSTEAQLSTLIGEVLERLSPITRTVQDEEGRWLQLTVRPYLTVDNRIDGTVITAVDIDQVKKSEQLVAAAQRYAESIVDTVREGLLVLDPELRVLSANHAFLQTFDVTRREIDGRPIEQLGRGEWKIPDLRQRLEALRGDARLEGFRVEREFEHAGKRTFILNARRIEESSSVLLAIVDVTELETYQERLRIMAFEATLAEQRERRRIAVDLHDRIGQALSLAQIKLAAMRQSVTGSSLAAIDEAVSLISQSVADTRTLIFELSPPVLYDLGLKDAIYWLAEDMEKREGLHIEVSDDGLDVPVDESTAALLFRAVRELLVNIVKHASSSRAKISMRRTDSRISVEVEDEGVGFDPEAKRVNPANGGFGLFSVREQITRLGGTLKVDSALNAGTRITISAPLKQDGE